MSLLRSQVIPAAIAVLTPVATPARIVRNDRSAAAKDAMEIILRTAGQGIVLSIDPIVGASLSGKPQRGAFASDSTLVLRLRMNQQTKPADFSADSLLDLADTIAATLLRSSALEAELAKEFLDEVVEDTGLLTYQLLFTVKTETSVP